MHYDVFWINGACATTWILTSTEDRRTGRRWSRRWLHKLDKSQKFRRSQILEDDPESRGLRSRGRRSLLHRTWFCSNSWYGSHHRRTLLRWVLGIQTNRDVLIRERDIDTIMSLKIIIKFDWGAMIWADLENKWWNKWISMYTICIYHKERYNYILCSLFVQLFSSFASFSRNLNSFIIISLFMLESIRAFLKLFSRIPYTIEDYISSFLFTYITISLLCLFTCNFVIL